MAFSARFTLLLTGLTLAGVLLAWSPASQSPDSEHRMLVDEGFLITNQTLIDRCSRCHAVEELRPGMFEIERRSDDHDWDGDSDVEYTCIQCHSMGRVMTQRRTEEEWGLLITTHRALYPLSDWQAFRYTGPASEQDDPRHPMERAINYLGEVYPLETPEWSAWAANKRPARLEGTWTISGHEPGKGPIYGTMVISVDPSDANAFETSSSYVYAESGEQIQRTGQTTVYTGYQWRGRSNPGNDNELREVMFVERDQQQIWGRWFRGDYDEIGPNISLRRAVGSTVASQSNPWMRLTMALFE